MKQKVDSGGENVISLEVWIYVWKGKAVPFIVFSTKGYTLANILHLWLEKFTMIFTET